MSVSTKVVYGGSQMNALLRRQQELLTQLRALILPALPQADRRSAELAVHLLDDVTDCIAGIISMLQIGSLSVGTSDGPALGLISNAGQKRRRNNNEERYSRSLVTTAPHYDGHHWRKYGHKSINGRQHARSYYRCAYTERNCSATKTIQQEDHDETLKYEEETAKYNVVYYGHHTCNIDDNTTNGADMKNSTDPIQSREIAGGGAAADFHEFEQGDLDVPALLAVLDGSQLNWDIIR